MSVAPPDTINGQRHVSMIEILCLCLSLQTVCLNSQQGPQPAEHLSDEKI